MTTAELNDIQSSNVSAVAETENGKPRTRGKDSQYAAGVLMQAVDATLIDREDGLMLARHAIVADHALAWPAAITAAEKQAVVEQLKSLGILVRKGV